MLSAVDAQRGALSPAFSRRRNPRVRSSWASYAREYVAKVEGELQKIRDGILALMDTNLVSSARTGESKVFYYRMKSDYYRYLADFATGEEKSKAVEDARVIDNQSSVDWKGLNNQDCEVLFHVNNRGAMWCGR